MPDRPKEMEPLSALAGQGRCVLKIADRLNDALGLAAATPRI
jgi:hypothetical protein